MLDLVVDTVDKAGSEVADFVVDTVDKVGSKVANFVEHSVASSPVAPSILSVLVVCVCVCAYAKAKAKAFLAPDEKIEIVRSPLTKPKILVIGEVGVGKSLLCKNICYILKDPKTAVSSRPQLSNSIIFHQINLNNELSLDVIEAPEVLSQRDDLKSIVESSTVVLFLISYDQLTKNNIYYLRDIQKYNRNIFVIFTKRDLVPKSIKEFELERARHECIFIHKVHYTGLMDDKRTLSGIRELLKYVFQFLPQSERYIQYLTQLEQNQTTTVEPVLKSAKASIEVEKSNIPILSIGNDVQKKTQKPTIEENKQAIEERRKKLKLEHERSIEEIKNLGIQLDKIFQSPQHNQAKVSPVVPVNAESEPLLTKEKSSKSSAKRSDFYEELLKSMDDFGYMNLELATAESLKSFNQPRDYDALKRAAKSYGFRCQNVLGDGNCFLYAVADQLNRALNLDLKDEEIKHLGKKLREQILEHIKKYQAIYQEYFKINGEFYEKNQKNFKRIHEAMVTALSYMLNVNLIIINDNNTAPIVLKQRSPICSLYLGYEVEIHFQSLVLENNIHPDLEKIIKDANFNFFGIQPSLNTVEALKASIYQLIDKQENPSITNEIEKNITEISTNTLEKNEAKKDTKNIKKDESEEVKIKKDHPSHQNLNVYHAVRNQLDDNYANNNYCYTPDFVEKILYPISFLKLSIKIFPPTSVDTVQNMISSIIIQNEHHVFIPLYAKNSQDQYEWKALIINKKNRLIFYFGFQKAAMIPQSIMDTIDQLKNKIGYRKPAVFMPNSFYNKLDGKLPIHDQGVYLVEVLRYFALLIKENITVTGAYLPNVNIVQNGVSLESTLVKFFVSSEFKIDQVRQQHLQELKKASSLSIAVPTQIFAMGLKLIKSLKFSEAHKQVETAISLYPNNQILWLLRGIALHHLGDNKKAIVCFDKSLEISNFWKSETLRYKGDSLLRLSRYKEAEECYQNALELQTNNKNKNKIILRILVHYAYCIILQGNYDRANFMIETITKNNDKFYPGIQLQGLCYYLTGNINIANRCFERANNNNDISYFVVYKKLNVYYYTALCLTKAGKFDIAVEYMQRGLILCNDYKPFFQLALSLVKGLLSTTNDVSISANSDMNALTILKKEQEERNNYIGKLETLIDQFLLKTKANAFEQQKTLTHVERLEKIIDKLLLSLNQKNDQIDILQEQNRLIEAELIRLKKQYKILQKNDKIRKKLNDEEKNKLLEQTSVLGKKVNQLEEKVNQLNEIHEQDMAFNSELQESAKNLQTNSQHKDAQISKLLHTNIGLFSVIQKQKQDIKEKDTQIASLSEEKTMLLLAAKKQKQAKPIKKGKKNKKSAVKKSLPPQMQNQEIIQQNESVKKPEKRKSSPMSFFHNRIKNSYPKIEGSVSTHVTPNSSFSPSHQ